MRVTVIDAYTQAPKAFTGNPDEVLAQLLQQYPWAATHGGRPVAHDVTAVLKRIAADSSYFVDAPEVGMHAGPHGDAVLHQHHGEKPLDAEPSDMQTEPVNKSHYRSADGITIPGTKSPNRAAYEQNFQQALANHFAGGDASQLKPATIPVAHIDTINPVYNEARYKLYGRMFRQKDQPPRILLRPTANGRYSAVDGNHRVAAARNAKIANIQAFVLHTAPKTTKAERFEMTSMEKGIGGAEKGREHLKLPVGTLHDEKIKVQDPPTSDTPGRKHWASVKEGMIESPTEGHPVSPRNPTGK